MTGLLTPILLSLIILHLAFDFTLLQAFAAGSALSTTSLGTTFTVISQAGFGDTRLGAVLTSAAITDDVVGLILLQVIVSLGQATASDHDAVGQSAAIGWAIGRPLLASMAMLVVSYGLMKLAMVPMYRWITSNLQNHLVPRWHTYNVSATSLHRTNYSILTSLLPHRQLIVALLVAHAYCAVASASGSERHIVSPQEEGLTFQQQLPSFWAPSSRA